MLDAQLQSEQADYEDVAVVAVIFRAFPVGSPVRLLVPIGGFAAGTEGVVVSTDGETYEIEIEPDRRILIDMDAIRALRTEEDAITEPGAGSGSPFEAAS
jgi:hypothetical protein